MKVLHLAAPLLLYVRTREHPNHRVINRLHKISKLIKHLDHRVTIRLRNSSKLTNPHQVAHPNQYKVFPVGVNRVPSVLTAPVMKSKLIAQIVRQSNA